jgi:plasmid stabilization system protein ParE
MARYVVSPEAARDLIQICRYIKEQSSLKTANRIELAIRDRIVLLARTPGAGHWRRDYSTATAMSAQFSMLACEWCRIANQWVALVAETIRNSCGGVAAYKTQPSQRARKAGPPASKRKPYPFALPVVVDRIEGAVLVDHLKSMDWAARRATFHSKAEPALLKKVRGYVGVLLGIR